MRGSELFHRALSRHGVDRIFGIMGREAEVLTRRIENDLEPGAAVATGQRLGRIRLGSTVVLDLPGRWELLGRDGQKVFGGETPLARLA